MNKKKIYIPHFVLYSFILLAIISCNKWDNHIRPNNQDITINLMQKISQIPELSTLTQYLKETGLDKILSSSKAYTIWAPDNNALKSLPDSIRQDTNRLKKLLINHIAAGAYFTNTMDDTLRILMINGKRISFYTNHFGNAEIEKGNIYVENGILHIINQVNYTLPNIWEYILNTRDSFFQNKYITALNYLSQDPSLATVDSIDPSTGKPIYKPGTGIVITNSFKQKIFDVSNEDSLYTYIMLTNKGFNEEKNNLKDYFKSANPAITDSNSAWSVVKDLAFKGVYLPDQFPDSFISKSNVKIHVNKNSIKQIKMASNGIIYVVDSVSFLLSEKIPPCIIQGENPMGFSDSSVTFMSKVFYRQRLNDSTGKPFTDIYLNLGSSGAGAYVDYATNHLFTTKYKVYWLALNDYTESAVGDASYGTMQPLPQILQISQYTDTASTPTFNVESDVPPNDYSEIYLGEFENNSYNWLLQYPSSRQSLNYNPATIRLRLLSPETIPSGVPHNLTIDYIKLVPDF